MEERGINSKATKIATYIMITATLIFTAMIYAMFIGLIKGNIAQGETRSAVMLTISVIPLFLLHMSIYVKIGMNIWEDWKYKEEEDDAVA